MNKTDSGIKDPSILFDFSRPEAARGWYDINDVVMGGVSQGRVSWAEKGCLVFEGNVSFENSGGFASIRSQDDDFDLACLWRVQDQRRISSQTGFLMSYR